MKSSMILPILSVISLVVQIVFGVQIPEEEIEKLALVLGNLVAVVITICGIFKNHDKKQ